LAKDANGVDKIYPTRAGGAEFISDTNLANNDQFVIDGNMVHDGGGVFHMTDYSQCRNTANPRPNYPQEAIGGTNNNHADNITRGYAMNKDDWVNFEMTQYIQVSSWSPSDSEIIMKGPTGTHHGPGNGSPDDCSGSSYGCRTGMENPTNSEFFKEQWHVHYESGGYVNLPSMGNFKDGNWHGIKYITYEVMVGGKKCRKLEHWLDEDGDGSGFVKVNELIDQGGWGNQAKQCKAPNADQILTWGNGRAMWRYDADSTNLKFKWLACREIDVNGNPDQGGGGSTTITRKIVYAPAGFDTDAGSFDANNTYLPTEILIHEMMNSITDPDWAARFGPDAWYDPATGDDFMDSCGATGRQYGTGVNSYWVPGYWSNSDNSCVVPHFIETDLGSSTKIQNPSGGTPFINAKIYLVFWGTGWRDRTAHPTVAGIVDRIQNRLLGTDNAYFAKLSQYSGIQTPTWGGSAVNHTFAVPSGHDIPESKAKNMLINTFETGLLPAPTNPNQNIYIIIPPAFTRIQHSSGGTAPNGFHDIMSATMTIGTSGGGGGGGGGSGGAIMQDGVKAIYPTKPSGWEWYMDNSDPFDGHLERGGGSDFNKIVKDNDGGWKPDKVGTNKFNIETDPSYKDGIGVCNLNYHDCIMRGYSYKTNWDLDHVEMTGFYRVASGSLGNDGIYMRGPCNHHPGSPCCQEYDYDVRVNTGSNGYVVHTKDHPDAANNFDEPGVGKRPLSFSPGSNLYFGIKYVHIILNNTMENARVRLECYLNRSGDKVTWEKISTCEDFIGKNWGTNDNVCGGEPYQVLAWRSPRMVIKWYDADVHFKLWSIRQIDPDGSFDNNPPPDPCPSGQHKNLAGDCVPDDPGGGGGGGGGTPPAEPTKVLGFFTLKRDINIYRTDPCEGNTGGGGSGGSAKFYSVPPDLERGLSNSTSHENRTRLVQRLNTSSVFIGKTIHQVDIWLRKQASPAATPVIKAKVWDSNGNVASTSSTTIAPNALTGSLVKTSFDFSSNTRSCALGDRIGVEWTGTTPSDYVVAAYSIEEGTGSTNSIVQQYEGTTWQSFTDRNMAMDVWE
jgi:hypothetical protein